MPCLPNSFKLNAMFWGIDLGGTKIEGVVLDAVNKDAVRCRLRVPTEAEHGYDHILNQISSLVAKMSEACGERPSRIGFGTPGVEDPLTSLMKNCNTQCLNGKPLKADLKHLLKIDITVANDANCFALAEATLGAAAGKNCVFGVIMGTGVGGGIAINGTALHGRQGIAGEWGHNVLDPDGPPCYCGKRGCVECIISGPALERWYAARSGTNKPLSEIIQSTSSDALAAATVDHLIESFGKAIAVIINILDPDSIVLGGGVSNVDALYSAGRLAAQHYVFNNRLETPIIKNALGDSAGVFGAAMLVTT